MLSSETKVVTYVNKKGERSTYPLSSAMESANLEMVKRLKYTKDILTHMLNANINTGKPSTNMDVGSLGGGPAS
jgi:polo-like kinase 1